MKVYIDAEGAIWGEEREDAIEYDVPTLDYIKIQEGVVTILTKAEVNTNTLQTEIADREATLRETFDSFPEADRKKMLEDELAKLNGE